MIRRLRKRWSRYWFSPAPLFDLAVCRVVIVGYQLQHLARMDHVEALGRQAAYPSFLYDPLPVLHLMIWPFGWTYRPSFEVLEAIYVSAVLAGALALVGLFSRFSLVVFAVGSVFLQAHTYSFGDFHHPEALVIIALAILALSPAGEVLSLDSVRRRRGLTLIPGEEDTGGDPIERESQFARWPLLLIAWLLGLAYLSAAFSKLVEAGLDWMNGFTLQYYLIRDGIRWNSDLGVWLGTHHHLAAALSWATVVFEATFFAAIIFPVLAILYLPVGVAMHVGIYLAMKAPFFGWLTLYCVFIPWSRVVRWARSATARVAEGADPFRQIQPS